MEKIVIRQTGDSLIATLDRHQFVARDNLYTIVSRNEEIRLAYILGLLNSCLLNWYYQKIINPEQGEALAQVKRGHIARLPIRTVDFKNQSDKARHDKMVSLVDQMLEFHKQLARISHRLLVKFFRLWYKLYMYNTLSSYSGGGGWKQGVSKCC